mmetsp:Transcript_50537/g.134423  ORF Transcript_50537/g.134423 Transcript_50537/m.134423 type:complete len:219 (-) Transcript_50537:1334-1990(-)
MRRSTSAFQRLPTVVCASLTGTQRRCSIVSLGPLMVITEVPVVPGFSFATLRGRWQRRTCGCQWINPWRRWIWNCCFTRVRTDLQFWRTSLRSRVQEMLFSSTYMTWCQPCLPPTICWTPFHGGAWASFTRPCRFMERSGPTLRQLVAHAGFGKAGRHGSIVFTSSDSLCPWEERCFDSAPFTMCSGRTCGAFGKAATTTCWTTTASTSAMRSCSSSA